MLAKNVETLKNMNGQIAKYGKWYARIIDPKVIPYEFKSKNETVYAEKFECVLVSKNPKQYMLATVPFSFNDRSAATKAKGTFRSNDIIEITTPAFDTKARPEWNGCPLKSVLLLTKPATIKHVPCTNTAMLKHPAEGLEVCLDIASLLEHLKDSGSAKPTRTFDFCGKFLGISEKKATENTAIVHTVSEATFVDAKGGKVKVAVWDKAYEMFDCLSLGAGVLILGCNATAQDGEVKLNIWPGTHISTSGEQAQSLTCLNASTMTTQELTAKFSPGDSLKKVCVRGRAANVCCSAGRCYGLRRTSDFSD